MGPMGGRMGPMGGPMGPLRGGMGPMGGRMGPMGGGMGPMGGGLGRMGGMDDMGDMQSAKMRKMEMMKQELEDMMMSLKGSGGGMGGGMEEVTEDPWGTPGRREPDPWAMAEDMDTNSYSTHFAFILLCLCEKWKFIQY